MNNNETKTRNTLFGIAITIVVIAFVYLMYGKYQLTHIDNSPTIDIASSTVVATSTDQTSSNGIITFKIPADFGLALNKVQILVKSYIPPCGDSFDYCLYYNGNTYEGTNFESAGLRIKKRVDLTTQTSCLSTPPEGYTELRGATATTSTFVISGFSVGDAGAGHSAAGELYRLAYNGTCHEFETRVGWTQYGNYPKGSIKEFTNIERDQIKAEIENILKDIELPGGEKVVLPAVE